MCELGPGPSRSCKFSGAFFFFHLTYSKVKNKQVVLFLPSVLESTCHSSSGSQCFCGYLGVDPAAHLGPPGITGLLPSTWLSKWIQETLSGLKPALGFVDLWRLTFSFWLWPLSAPFFFCLFVCFAFCFLFLLFRNSDRFACLHFESAFLLCYCFKIFHWLCQLSSPPVCQKQKFLSWYLILFLSLTFL